MATIRTAISIYDGVTSPLQNMRKAMDIVLNSFEAMQAASGNAVDVSAIQDARNELAKAEVAFDGIEQKIRESEQEQQQFNQTLRAASPTADALGSKLKGILATVTSIAGIKGVLGWVKENLELADTQRNAENQLKAVLANMGVEPVEVPVVTDTANAIKNLNRYEDAVNALTPIQETDIENNLTLNTASALGEYDSFLADVSGNSIQIDITADATQTISAFDAIAAKASEIQSRGIYGDEAMIAGAAEFATYFDDAEAIMSMIDTTSMVDYATNLGKIMSGSYDAMTKKGFEFTDAQKAIIEGTATQAQIMEALGEEYLDASADMQAAAAINAVIAESWDGLYETMSNTPEGKIIQLQNKFGDLREELGNRLYGSVLRVFDAFDSRWGEIETLMNNLAYAATVLVAILGTLAEAALTVGTFFSENWSWIEPIIWGIVGALTAYYGALLIYNTIQRISNTLQAISAAHSALKAGRTLAEAAATTTATGAQVGLNAALLACPVFWIVAGILAIIAAIVAVVRALDVWGAKTHSVIGTITGLFAVAGAFIANLFIAVINTGIDVFTALWNFIGSFANFFANVFNDPVGSIVRLFADMADTVLSLLESLASAIDTIFGSNLAGAVSGWRDGLKGLVESTFGKGEEVFEKLDPSALHLDRIEYSTAFEAGASFGDGISDSFNGLFNIPGMDAFEMGSTWDGLTANTAGIAGSGADTAANTAAMRDALDYMEEDLAYMVDLAEREAINRFTTAEITLNQENTNYVDSDTDLDGIMDAWAADFAERLDISAEGM